MGWKGEKKKKSYSYTYVKRQRKTKREPACPVTPATMPRENKDEHTAPSRTLCMYSSVKKKKTAPRQQDGALDFNIEPAFLAAAATNVKILPGISALV